MTHVDMRALSQRTRALDASRASLDAHAFCSVCDDAASALDALGVAFAPASADVRENIARVRASARACERATTSIANANERSMTSLWEVLRREKASGRARDARSVARGALWLKRFLEFTCALLRAIGSDATMDVGDAAKTSYEKTLKRYHGWLSRTAFAVVLAFPPSTETFVDALGGSDARSAMVDVADGFDPVLALIDEFLSEEGLNDPTPA